MKKNLNQEEIIKRLQQCENQNVGVNPEDFLNSLLFNILRTSTTRSFLMHNQNNGVIYEKKEGSVLNQAGYVEDIKEENNYMLGDGCSTSSVVICQTCGEPISKESLKRCECGRTTCISKACGQTYNDDWYCCRWHAFLGGFLRLNLRFFTWTTT